MTKELNQPEREEISRLIRDGMTSGILDLDDKRIVWELNYDKFTN